MAGNPFSTEAQGFSAQKILPRDPNEQQFTQWTKIIITLRKKELKSLQMYLVNP